ncbi:MAG: hypothetical protein NTV40_02460 [Solirubrobacterales bacterium]|nr:hypothetical protein [Solirubrobacterales bacterium]
MSLVDKVFPRIDATNLAVAKGGDVDSQSTDSERLLERRGVLARQLAELQWDLGGLAYEMAIRDHFRPDVLVSQAARLQQVDGELAEVERLLRMESNGAAGNCPSCDALHSRGAVFCWQCGAQLMATGDQSQSPDVEPPTVG